MNRDEFMERLEYLLSDIPEEEKKDALSYYRDYLDDAGERAEEVIREFGSPERIASIIRSDLAGTLEEGGEFTERGYEDDRFREPNYQVANRLDLPEAHQETGGGPTGPRSDDHTSKPQQKTFKSSKVLKIVLWIILILVVAPLFLGMGGVIFGLTAGLLGLLAGFVVLLAVLTFTLFLAGISLFILGILRAFAWLPDGIMFLGLSLIVFGLGILSLMASIAFYGKFLPWLFRTAADAVGRLLYGRRKTV